MLKLAVLVGSLRQESINLKYARALEKLGAGHFGFHFVDMSLPLYNDDLWQDPPAKVRQLKVDLAAADGVLIVTPEYNRSMPAVTKNAIDWASRPYGHNAWKGKPVALTGASHGSQGTAVAQSQLRSTLVILETVLMGGPEVYITFAPELVDANYDVTNEGTAKFLKGFLDAFGKWIDMVKK